MRTALLIGLTLAAAPAIVLAAPSVTVTAAPSDVCCAPLKAGMSGSRNGKLMCTGPAGASRAVAAARAATSRA